MSYQLVIEIPTAATDLNRILGVNRFIKHKTFEKVKAEMRKLIRGKEPSIPLENFRISVVRHGAKYLDYDNYISSLKPFIDSLTLTGVIVDDRWQFIKSIDVDQVISKEKKLVIKVEGYEAAEV